MIAVVDYKKGNLLSVERGLCEAGANACITANPAKIARANAIVLPGVGAFSNAIETMRKLGQADVIKQSINRGVPFLGICLGLHLLFDSGTEGSLSCECSGCSKPSNGLGILDGCVCRMPKKDTQGKFHKVPHVGWNVVHQTNDSVGRGSQLFEGIKQDTFFYFTHSYIVPENKYTIATTTHSTTFPCAIQKGNCFAVQFHPEKSSDAGNKLLRNFVDVVKGVSSIK